MALRRSSANTQRLPDLLRVVRKGPAVKSSVDDAIDQCSAVYNLRESIEESRILAERSTDDKQKRINVSKGIHSIKLRLVVDTRSRLAQPSTLFRADCVPILFAVN